MFIFLLFTDGFCLATTRTVRRVLFKISNLELLAFFPSITFICLELKQVPKLHVYKLTVHSSATYLLTLSTSCPVARI